eukprot:gene4370-5539_t
MIANQFYGLLIGLGTIDRMKQKRGLDRYIRPVPFNYVFGDDPLRYLLPLPPVFQDEDLVLGYRLGDDIDDAMLI